MRSKSKQSELGKKEKTVTEPRSTVHCAHNVSLNILFYDNTANTILIKTMGDTALMLFVEKNGEHKTDRNNTQ